MRNSILPSILAALSLSIVACGDSGDSSDDGPQKAPLADDSSANRGAQAMLTATAAGRPTTAGLRRGDDGSSFRSTEGSGDVNASTACDGGGTIAFEGRLDLEIPDVDVDLPDVDPNNPPDAEDIDVNPGDYIPRVSFDFDVTFDGCTVDGVTIDGLMTYSMETIWDEAAQTVEFTWGYEGAVDFGGAIDGGCAFNFGGAAAGAEDWAGADPADFEGDVCGFDAEGVDLGE